jgi:hypothetical protein
LALLVLFVSKVTLLCPDVCTCKWKGGKQTVECVNASLSAIPALSDANTQVLDISRNYIPVLHGAAQPAEDLHLQVGRADSGGALLQVTKLRIGLRSSR